MRSRVVWSLVRPVLWTAPPSEDIDHRGDANVLDSKQTEPCEQQQTGKEGGVRVCIRPGKTERRSTRRRKRAASLRRLLRGPLGGGGLQGRLPLGRGGSALGPRLGLRATEEAEDEVGGEEDDAGGEEDHAPLGDGVVGRQAVHDERHHQHSAADDELEPQGGKLWTDLHGGHDHVGVAARYLRGGLERAAGDEAEAADAGDEAEERQLRLLLVQEAEGEQPESAATHRDRVEELELTAFLEMHPS
uniref:Uncharacterized protein n=1 Tax=Steinernema glaseri TaxID=37863 RepID=A0A1I7YXK9_9BILA